MIIVIAAALAATQPVVAQTAPAPALHSEMGQAGTRKKECCCCEDKMDKEHASHDMDRMRDHHDHTSR